MEVEGRVVWGGGGGGGVYMYEEDRWSRVAGCSIDYIWHCD